MLITCLGEPKSKTSLKTRTEVYGETLTATLFSKIKRGFPGLHWSTRSGI